MLKWECRGGWHARCRDRSIATVSIGGISLAGGKGTLTGVIIGVMTLGIIDLPAVVIPLLKSLLL
jgi:ABC-type xylose transport system permease subunit